MSAEVEQKKLIDIVIGQTDYSKAVAAQKLKLHEWDHISVIHEYMGIVPKKEKIVSMNQQIYKEIRNFMDTRNNINYTNNNKKI